MTGFDYVVATLVLASVLLGAWRGVVGEIIALTAWVLAFFAARWWGAEIAQVLFHEVITDPALRIVAGWVVVFIGVLILMGLLRLAVRGMLKAFRPRAQRPSAGGRLRPRARPSGGARTGGARRHDVTAQRAVVAKLIFRPF